MTQHMLADPWGRILEHLCFPGGRRNRRSERVSNAMTGLVSFVVALLTQLVVLPL